MTKSIALILFGIAFTLISYSQDKALKIEREVNEYYSDTLYSQLDFHYSNSSDSAYVIWIEKHNVDSLSKSIKIRNYFFTLKGDWSIMRLIWDGNVEGFVPGLFTSFFKIIKPKEQFTITLLKRGEISTDLINSLEKHIMFVNAVDIKGFQIDSSVEIFDYKANSLIILTEWIK